jgi:hypothetical protein
MNKPGFLAKQGSRFLLLHRVQDSNFEMIKSSKEGWPRRPRSRVRTPVGTTIIAKDFPEAVRSGLDPGRVEDLIRQFGDAMDCIEDGCISLPPLTRLQEVTPGAPHPL